MESRPNIVPCGPRSTSTRSRSTNSWVRKPFVATCHTPSTYVLTAGMPRMRNTVPPVPPPPPVMTMFGTPVLSFSMLSIPRISRPSPVIATIEMGTS